MLLAIDSGNTNIVFAVYEGENLKGEWRASSDAKRTADEYGVWLTHLMLLDKLKTEDISEQPTLQLTPRRHGVDGFFVAIFERTG